MDLITPLLHQLMTNPAIQAMVMGAVVKYATDFLKAEFVTLDAAGVKVYTVPVQAIVAACSFLAGLGNMYLTSQLHTFDPSVIVNFITVTLPIYLSAMGVHLLHSHIAEVTTPNVTK